MKLFFITILSFSVFAKSAEINKKIEFEQKTLKLVNEFQIQQFNKEKLNPLKDLLAEEHETYRECVEECREEYGKPPRNNTGCMKYVCDQLGSYKCNETSELDKVAEICRGVNNSKCMEFTCSQIGSYKCNEVSELELVAKSCKGVRGSSCMKYVCDQVGNYKCNELDEVSIVSKMCRGNNGKDCIEFTCNRLGSYKCNEISELQAIADKCAGR